MKPWTIVVVHADEGQLQVHVAREGPGRVTGQHVDFARPQDGEAGLTGRRRVLDLGRIAQDGGRDGLTDGRVEALPRARVVGEREAGEAGGDAAGQRALGFYVVQRRGVSDGGAHGHGRAGDQDGFEVHVVMSPMLWLMPANADKQPSRTF
jgi:hypothetical protein